MKKLLTFLAAVFFLVGLQTSSAVAAPWDKLPAAERDIYVNVFRCVGTTTLVTKALQWPLAALKGNPRQVAPRLYRAVRSSPRSPLHLWYTYRVTRSGHKIVNQGKIVIGANRTVFLDYYIIRAIRSGKYNFRKNPRSVAKFATGKYFCSEPLKII